MYKILEVAVCDFIYLFPNLLLAVSPFRRNLRYSKKIMNSLFLLICILHAASINLSMGHLALTAIFDVVWLILYLMFYWICCRAEISKLLFVLLIIINYEHIVAVTVNHLSEESYTLYTALNNAIILLFTYPIIYLMMEEKINPLVNNSQNDNIWRTMWLIPAISCFPYYCYVFTAGGAIVFTEKRSNVLPAIILNAGSLFVTYIVVTLIGQNNTCLCKKTESYRLDMQVVQYESKKNAMEDELSARHNISRTLIKIQSYLHHDDKEALQEFLAEKIESLPGDESLPIVKSNKEK